MLEHWTTTSYYIRCLPRWSPRFRIWYFIAWLWRCYGVFCEISTEEASTSTGLMALFRSCFRKIEWLAHGWSLPRVQSFSKGASVDIFDHVLCKADAEPVESIDGTDLVGYPLPDLFSVRPQIIGSSVVGSLPEILLFEICHSWGVIWQQYNRLKSICLSISGETDHWWPCRRSCWHGGMRGLHSWALWWARWCQGQTRRTRRLLYGLLLLLQRVRSYKASSPSEREVNEWHTCLCHYST